MLEKRLRLRKSSDIERVFRKGRPLFFHFLGGKYLAGENGIQATFIASKKYFPLAVSRNKAKRLLREVFREIMKEKGLISGEYAFFYARRPESLTIEECRKALLGCLKNNTEIKRK